MIYYKNIENNNIIIPSKIDIKKEDNQDSYVYEHKINTYYLRLILEILTKDELNIFLASMKFINNVSPGYPLYYGYSYQYDIYEDCAPYYTIEEIGKMLVSNFGFETQNIENTFTKLKNANVIIPKKAYITLKNEIDIVYFINDLVISYENTGMGIGYLSDLKRDDNHVIIMESYCELPYSYYHPEVKKTKSESQSDRNSYESQQWTIDVKERANYTCQCCESKEKKGMAAHHIKNWATHKELRYELSNGICLCEKCHNPYYEGSFHNIYRTRKNTPEQLQEYINTKRESLGLSMVSLEDIVG